MKSLLCALASTLGCVSPTSTPVSNTLVIERATLITMEGEQVLADCSVLVEGERIVAIGRGLEVPAGARRVDGRGKFLIPGLVDMHAHLFSDDKIPDEFAPDELGLMLALGVTAFRDPIGKPELLELKRRVALGDVLGPQMWIASPQISGRRYGTIFLGREVTDPTAARAAVRDFRAEGYDFIKLTLAISREVYDAVVDEARSAGIRVIGHVGPDVGLSRAIEAGQQIEHLDQFLECLVPADAPFQGSVSDSALWRAERWQSLDWLDAEKIPELARRVAAAGIWNTPTSSFLHTAFAHGRSAPDIDASPDARFVSAALKAELLRGDVRYWETPPSAERRARYVELRRRIVRELQAAGAKLMAGSDAPEWLLLYGFSLHRELQEFVAAGLTPHQALATATCHPHEWLGDLEQVGTIRAGRRADLVLLDADPLESIENTQRIAGVMSRGRWLDRAELDRLLEQAARRLSRAPMRE